MRSRTTLAALALVLFVACAEEGPAPAPTPAAPPPVTPDEVTAALTGALGDARFADQVQSFDGRIAAMTDPAAAEKVKIARDRVLVRALLLATAVPDVGAFVAPLAKGNPEAAAFRLLDDLAKRDPEVAAKVDPWTGVLRSVKDASLPVLLDEDRLTAWVHDADPLVSALRLFAMRRLGDELAGLLKQPEARRWELIVSRFGPLVCPDCLKARETGGLDATYFLGAGNTALVCAAAKDKLPPTSPASTRALFDVLRTECATRRDPLADPAVLRATLGGSNVLLVQLLAAIHQLGIYRIPENPDAFTRKLGDELRAFRDGYDNRAYPLTLPFVTGEEIGLPNAAAGAPGADPRAAAKETAPAAAAPADAKAEKPASAVPAAGAPAAAPAADAKAEPAKPTYVPSVTLPASPRNQPLAVVTVRADGVYVGTRPILQSQRGSFRLLLPNESYPGVRVAETKDLAALLAAKEPGEALTKTGGFAAVVAEVTRQRALLGEAIKTFHASLPADEFLGAAEARVLVSIEGVGDPRVMPAVFRSLVEAGFSVVELVVGATHTPFGVPTLLAYPDVLARESAARPADTHARALLVVADARSTVALYPADVRRAGAPEPARTGDAPEPAGLRKVAGPDKAVFRAELPATTPDFEEKLAGAARWLQTAGKAAPLATLGVARGGDWKLLAPLANVLAHRVEAASRAEADAPALHASAITCAPTVACNGTLLLLDPAVVLPQPGKAPVKAVVTEARPLGFCAKENINKVVMGRMGALKFCYEKELQTYPDLQGKVTMNWTIEEDGAVSGVGPGEDTMKSKRINECLSQTISKLKFDKPQGGVCVVRWPFVFKM